MKEMVKVMFLMGVSLLSVHCSGTKNTGNILSSHNIDEIQYYLDHAHPDDPKNALLKKRIIDLKNREWMKNSTGSVAMKAMPVHEDKNLISDVDPKKFEQLLNADLLNQKNRTVHILNEMFNSNSDSPNALLMVKNHSHCNTILHIKEGTEAYDLAVPHDGENFIVLGKGKYTISGNICGAWYEKIKNLDHGIYLTLK